MSSVDPLVAPTVVAGSGRINARSLDAALASIQATINTLIAALGVARQSDDTFAEDSIPWRAFNQATKDSIAVTMQQVVAIRNQVTKNLSQPLGDAEWVGITPEGGQNIADVTYTYSGAPKAGSIAETITVPGDPAESFTLKMRVRAMVPATWVRDAAFRTGAVYCETFPFLPTGGVTVEGGRVFTGDLNFAPFATSAPVITPAAGSYLNTQLITITPAAGCAVAYTTDGSTPTIDSPIYAGPFTIASVDDMAGNVTVKALAFGGGFLASSVATSAFSTLVAATPAISPTGSQYGSQVVTMTSDAGTNIYYTTDGSTPTEGGGTSVLYSAPKYVGQLAASGATNTVKMKAFNGGYLTSPEGSGSLTGVATPTPVISPATGDYTGSQLVTITCAEAGATIRYTTDGSTPTSSHGTIYSLPFALSTFLTLGQTKTVKAVAYNAYYAASGVASTAFTRNACDCTVLTVGQTVAFACSAGINSPGEYFTITFNGVYDGSQFVGTAVNVGGTFGNFSLAATLTRTCTSANETQWYLYIPGALLGISTHNFTVPQPTYSPIWRVGFVAQSLVIDLPFTYTNTCMSSTLTKVYPSVSTVMNIAVAAP